MRAVTIARNGIGTEVDTPAWAVLQSGPSDYYYLCADLMVLLLPLPLLVVRRWCKKWESCPNRRPPWPRVRPRWKSPDHHSSGRGLVQPTDAHSAHFR